MNTGADDDSLNTPTFAFRRSSARAAPFAAISIRPANNSTQPPRGFSQNFIAFPLLQAFRDALVPPDERALFSEPHLQLFNRDVMRRRVAVERQRRRGSRRFAHRKTGAGDPRCR